MKTLLVLIIVLGLVGILPEIILAVTSGIITFLATAVLLAKMEEAL